MDNKMETKFNINVEVTSCGPASRKQVESVLRKLIDAGMSNIAKQPSDSAGEDNDLIGMEMELKFHISENNTKNSSVEVKHPNEYPLGEREHTHILDVMDARIECGQALMTVRAKDGNEDETLSVVMEVRTNPLNEIQCVPCADIHFNSDAFAVSLLKIGNRILVRPDPSAKVTPVMHSFHGMQEQLFWLG